MFIKSIRWRLQLWLAFLLICTLSGFAVATYEAHRIKQYQQVDAELDRRFETLARLARGRLVPGGVRPPFEERSRHDSRRDHSDNRRSPGHPSEENTNATIELPPGGFEMQPPPNFERLRQEDEQLGIYFVIWNYDGTRLEDSTNAPVDLPRPMETQPPDSGPQFRTRGSYREGYDYNREGRCVLVGRSIVPELDGLRSFAFILAGAGVAVLVLGLAGGWLIASRAIRPVATISATAGRISAGHLSERINVADTDSELGRLAAVLNSTFTRLETAFAQQKQFTADASHELRTPLAVLISEAQTTLSRPRSAEEYRETVEACLDTAQQMRQLTESLLALARFDARQEPARHQPLDLAETVRACVEHIQPLADKRGIRMHCYLAPAELIGDVACLSQVINNLLTNAIHYNQAQGEIQISTRQEKNTAILTVSDTGLGIAPEDLPHIFERFYRADKSRSHANAHSGLGLAICQAIVEAHGGSIHVRSTPGQGSEFTATFPQTKSP